MHRICPVCNGLFSIDRFCPKCGEKLVDGGIIQDYDGPYSPYQDRDIIEFITDLATEQNGSCVHLYYCPVCRWDTRLAVDKVSV
ncbi:MAG: hypothetical protein ACOX8W_11195 [bacterium]|jgi:hypothetical protein